MINQQDLEKIEAVTKSLLNGNRSEQLTAGILSVLVGSIYMNKEEELFLHLDSFNKRMLDEANNQKAQQN